MVEKKGHIHVRKWETWQDRSFRLKRWSLLYKWTPAEHTCTPRQPVCTCECTCPPESAADCDGSDSAVINHFKHLTGLFCVSRRRLGRTPVASGSNQKVIGTKSNKFPNATKPSRDLTYSRPNMLVNPSNLEKLKEKANCLQTRMAARCSTGFLYALKDDYFPC